MSSEIDFYKQNWWMYLLSGIVTLLFGFVAIMNPAQTFLTLSFFFGFYLLIGGVIEIVQSLSGSRHKKLWFLSLIFGAIEAIFGVYILQRPLLSLATFVVFAAFGLLVRGIIHFIEALDSSYNNVYRVWQVIAGAVSVLASSFVWRYPVKGTLAFVWVLGVMAIINGPLMIAFALEAKKGFSGK